MIGYISLFLILLLTLCCCTDSSLQEPSRIIFPEKTEWVKSILDNLKDDLIKYEQKEFTLYCKMESNAANNIEQLKKLINTAIVRIEEVLNIDQSPKGFYLLMLDSREEMEQVVGLNVKGFASVRNDMAFFVYNSKIRPYFKHELFHLIAYNLWGEPSNRLLDEGGALYTDNECLRYSDPISTINKYLYENKRWFEIEELINNFSEKADENDMIAYLQAAFIFRFLYENYEMKYMEELWKDGFSEFENIYGFSITQLDKFIENELNQIDLENVNWDELMDKGCG
ncbi:MAG: hypothetical protein KJO12_10065 [Ignavibacteria bacterium]|nr:hypothetical protein [Ignavibacteria bacterium]